MNESIRIRTTPNGNDKYLRVKINQDFDFIEILSLKISQEDTYRKYCSDYGVVVGRVSCNQGFGISNAKVSIFIPLSDLDSNNPLISGLYPYEIVTDKNSDGIRYNLLPKNGNPSDSCSTPIGSFPTKREVLDNPELVSVYDKYYKFTTTTNYAGDYMLFGVPVGTYNLHIDVDISDIGIASQSPFDLISQGTPSKLFETPNKFKKDKNLDKLIQIKTINAGVNVQPFWGDIESCEIGINRVDFDINHNITPSAIFVGSIFGDQDKHSVNKECRPRKELGELCEQITGSGSIEMIRKTIDDSVESFDVEGGRVIDEDGTWSYQIPMNLDYVITNEEGQLIPSNDPNIGIPTRARVRFNIGLDETGGEGRLRTRARYLVPNNPNNVDEIDYTFGEDTKDTSFRDLYWNKLYTVSNFISRFQRNGTIENALPALNRSITGIKDTDGCSGTKNPFPYNRANSVSNPIFFILCLTIKMVAFIVYLINATVIPIINGLISFVNALGGSIDKVGCITIKCPEDDAAYFAPGCKGDTDGWSAANPQPNYYPGDPFGHGGSNNLYVGLDDCIAFEIAKSLNMYKFDFYNDWVNGSLFAFLLKYKKKSNGKENFCEYDCGDWNGIDGNDDGASDNICRNNILLDTCLPYNANSDLTHLKAKDSGGIRDGVVKKTEENLFYAASTHDVKFKLFATELVNLGSIYDCDWQGIPKIEKLLTPSSYKIPPDVQQLSDDNLTLETCGMVGVDGTTSGLFFSINCVGVHVNDRQCLNLRHVCEIGVDIDQVIKDPITGAIITPADCIIGVDDIDDNKGKWVRDVLYGLNNTTTPWIGTNELIIPQNGFTTNFNTLPIQNGLYDFTSTDSNGVDYINYRGYNIQGTNTDGTMFGQPKHSYYFYFGLNPGKTAIDKMNQKFFNNCKVITNKKLIIKTQTTIANPNGSVIFNFIGGQGPYSYTVEGMGLIFNGITNNQVEISDLPIGQYTIVGFDSFGIPINKTFEIYGQQSLYSIINVTANCTSSISNDGKIKISVGGGQPNYFYSIVSSTGLIIADSVQFNTNIVEVDNLSVDNIGYTITITDSLGDSTTTYNVIVSGPEPILLSSSKTDVICYGSNTGSIYLTINGGQGPFNILTTGPGGYSNSTSVMNNLVSGTYYTNITDSLGTSASITTVIYDLYPQLQCFITTTGPISGNYTHVISATGGLPPYTNVGITVDSNPTITSNVTDSQGCTSPNTTG